MSAAAERGAVGPVEEGRTFAALCANCVTVKIWNTPDCRWKVFANRPPLHAYTQHKERRTLLEAMHDAWQHYFKGGMPVTVTDQDARTLSDCVRHLTAIKGLTVTWHNGFFFAQIGENQLTPQGFRTLLEAVRTLAAANAWSPVAAPRPAAKWK